MDGLVPVVLTVVELFALVPQALPALTETDPPLPPKLTVMLVVPCPEAILAPAGTLQVYVLAPEMAAIEKVTPDWFGQMLVEPVMVPGAAGTEPVVLTVMELTGLVPQEFPAVTDTIPPVALKLTEMPVVPWPETIVAPVGTVQV